VYALGVSWRAPGTAAFASLLHFALAPIDAINIRRR
jgi:hypothetical protein